MFQKKTIRRMKGHQREVALISNHAEITARRIKALVPMVADLELDSRALANATGTAVGLNTWPPCPRCGGHVTATEDKPFGCENPDCTFPKEEAEELADETLADAAQDALRTLRAVGLGRNHPAVKALADALAA